MPQPDFTIRHDGSIFMFTPLTGICRQWIEDNVQSEGWQWFGNALCVDQHLARGLKNTLEDAGFAGECE